MPGDSVGLRNHRTCSEAKRQRCPSEYRVTSRSAQGVPCHAEQEECKSTHHRWKRKLEDQRKTFREWISSAGRGSLPEYSRVDEILHELWSASLVHERSEGRKKRIGSISILTASATWSKNAEEHLKILPLLKDKKTSFLKAWRFCSGRIMLSAVGAGDVGQAAGHTGVEGSAPRPPAPVPGPAVPGC